MLFLRVLDAREWREAEEAEAFGLPFTPALEAPYRWRDWASPKGATRQKLATGTLGAFKGFVDRELLPYLRALRDKPNATSRQRVIAEIVANTERTRVDTDRNLQDVLDRYRRLRRGGGGLFRPVPLKPGL